MGLELGLEIKVAIGWGLSLLFGIYMAGFGYRRGWTLLRTATVATVAGWLATALCMWAL